MYIQKNFERVSQQMTYTVARVSLIGDVRDPQSQSNSCYKSWSAKKAVLFFFFFLGGGGREGGGGDKNLGSNLYIIAIAQDFHCPRFVPVELVRPGRYNLQDKMIFINR